MRLSGLHSSNSPASAPHSTGLYQSALGIVLTTLGTRESGTEKLEQATQAFRLALQENTREPANLPGRQRKRAWTMPSSFLSKGQKNENAAAPLTFISMRVKALLRY